MSKKILVVEDEKRYISFKSNEAVGGSYTEDRKIIGTRETRRISAHRPRPQRRNLPSATGRNSTHISINSAGAAPLRWIHIFASAVMK